ncbi:amidohydrolase family protein [Algoriphagus hitonicola]|uniref:L-fuconolactonase n=1 Tax=Algoriphagus hitonicola TaxID=435880 RepID=A0A1I2TCX6_9BACT|nr:amidohydrolase family protein [Algoriphagus hitonicola]SFG61147.1 L-fuconolactonase [Algoriphagus hitonicola]
MNIDSHQHFWKYDPKRHGWIDERMKQIRKDFLPGDLKPHLDSNQIHGCIAVQAEESLEETDFLLDLADKHSWIAGIVGWTDLAASDLDLILDQNSKQPKLKGFREVLQSRDVEYFLRPEFIQGLKKIYQKGYSYDLLIYPNQLLDALQLIKKCGENRIVIDHLAKPKIKSGIWRDWKKNLKPFSEREYIYCKLSGMVTEADWKNWTYEDLIPYMEIALELFGPDRLMFGSDWPVCLLAGEYEQIFEIVNTFTDSLSNSEKARISGQTAQEFYQISNFNTGYGPLVKE